MPIGARVPVASTPAVPLPFGLWTVVVPGLIAGGDEANPHWRNGVDVQPDPCERARTTTDFPPPDPKQITSTLPIVGYNPVTVYARVDMGPVGRGQDWETEVQARAAAALTMGEARALERVFWTGDIDDSTQTLWPHLAADTPVLDGETILQPAAVIPQAGVLDIVEGIGVLEEAIGACYGGVPVLHIPRSALVHMDSFGIVKPSGGKLSTLSGSLVNAGAGNQHTGPNGAVPAYPNVWLYATGQITGRRTAIEYPSTIRDGFDQSRNQLVYIAERTYVLGWDCCLFAVQVSLGGRATGKPSDPGPLP